MFELLSDIQSVPIDLDSLTMVHRGMNKVRVSVGDHISEPSEVYIITGKVNGKLESFVIFYMLEPGIHVVYGSDQNPYAPDMKEQVIEEAVIFVEEMGSILEEVPWEDMTTDQKSAWAEKEILYSASLIEELEEVEEVEEVEKDALEDVVSAEDTEFDTESGFVEVSENEVQQALGESDLDEGLEDEDVTHVDDDDDTGDEDREDVVVAEGDFDELLKQAFLKPDVAEKTKRKSAKKVTDKVSEEQLPIDDQAVEENEDVMVVDEMESPTADMVVESERRVEDTDEIDPASMLLSEPDPGGGRDVTSKQENERALSEKDTRIKVVRFLSRF